MQWHQFSEGQIIGILGTLQAGWNTKAVARGRAALDSSRPPVFRRLGWPQRQQNQPQRSASGTSHLNFPPYRGKPVRRKQCRAAQNTRLRLRRPQLS